MPWIRVFTDFDDNPKTIKLKRILKNHLADAYPQRLWRWVLKHAPGGDLSRFDEGLVAEGCGWRGDPKAFVKALIEAGFIDGETMQVHDWQEGSGQYETLTKRGRERVQKHRAKNDVTVTTPLRNAHVTLPDSDSDPDPDLKTLSPRKERAGRKRASVGVNGLREWMYDRWRESGYDLKWGKEEALTIATAVDRYFDGDHAKVKASWLEFLRFDEDWARGHSPQLWVKHRGKWAKARPQGVNMTPEEQAEYERYLERL